MASCHIKPYHILKPIHTSYMYVLQGHAHHNLIESKVKKPKCICHSIFWKGIRGHEHELGKCTLVCIKNGIERQIEMTMCPLFGE